MSENTESKPAWKKPATWLTLAAAILSFALGAEFFEINSTADRVLMFLGGVLTSMGYAVSRGPKALAAGK